MAYDHDKHHPPARDLQSAIGRLETLANRLRLSGDEYNADIAELEILPFLRSPTNAAAKWEAWKTKYFPGASP